jgi:hypothetical protein
LYRSAESMKIKILLSWAFLLVFIACKKENVNDDSIYGTWIYQQVELLSDENPKTLPLTGSFVFQASDRSILAGGTLYGEKLACLAELPRVGGDDENLQPFTQAEKIYFTESTTVDNYNFRNFFNGIYGYEIQGGLINYSSLTMSLNKENEMTIQLTNTAAALVNSYSTVSIKLVKQ